MKTSSRVGQTLSLRLETIKSFYNHQQNIWDIGCDHGLLGLSFLGLPGVSINLVDASKAVIETLNNKIKDSYITEKALNIIHSEGQNLELEGSDNSIFIAGMGGKEIGEIILNLLPKLKDDSQIIISPHRKILELRSLLNELPLSLADETVIFEDQQYYQIISLVPGSHGNKVTLYGEKLWNGEMGEAYREHQLKYFSLHQDPVSRNYCEYLKFGK